MYLFCIRIFSGQDFAILRECGAIEISPKLSVKYESEDAWEELAERWRMHDV